MIEFSDAIDKLAPALHAAQGAIKGYEKDKPNSHFKSKYATLESVIGAAKPALQSNGLAVVQAPGAIVNGCLQISTLVLHTSGQWLRSVAEVPLPKADPQGMGSATTYGKRYSLCALLGLAEADDDGEAARLPDAKQADAPPPAADPFDAAIVEALKSSIAGFKQADALSSYMTSADTKRALESLGTGIAAEIQGLARNRFKELRQ